MHCAATYPPSERTYVAPRHAHLDAVRPAAATPAAATCTPLSGLHIPASAGANAGFSTLLFKSLWPDATVVSLEPDPSNFDMLKRNTAGCAAAWGVAACWRSGVLPFHRRQPLQCGMKNCTDVWVSFPGPPAPWHGYTCRSERLVPLSVPLCRRLPKVHPLNVGLWGRTANITQTGFHGNWGRVFKEAEPGQPGMPAFSVQVGRGRGGAAGLGVPPGCGQWVPTEAEPGQRSRPALSAQVQQVQQVQQGYAAQQ